MLGRFLNNYTTDISYEEQTFFKILTVVRERADFGIFSETICDYSLSSLFNQTSP